MADQKFPLVYKGHPLRRKDNLIYYGSMADKYKTEKDNLYAAMDVAAVWLARALANK